MRKKNILERVELIVNDIIDISYELVDIEYEKEGPYYYLRVFLDKESGITLDDCQLISEKLSDVLDKEDFIKDQYFLEISSPGIDRPLKKDKDFERFKGEDIEIKLYKSIQGLKLIEGELLDYNNEIISINNKELGKIDIEKKDTAIVRLAVKF